MGSACNCSENVTSNNADLSSHGKQQFKPMYDSLNTWFPGAMKPSLVEKVTYDKLTKLGFTVENTLFADSTCPDEINHDAGLQDITSKFF